MPPGEGDPDLRSAALWPADVQQPESKFVGVLVDRSLAAGGDVGLSSKNDKPRS